MGQLSIFNIILKSNGNRFKKIIIKKILKINCFEACEFSMNFYELRIIIYFYIIRVPTANWTLINNNC